jgi:plasmid maintenance system antidote protein VapI
MTFAEKLARLTEDRLKTRVSRKAGLPPAAISDYIAKGNTPGADTALRLARVLGVSVEWLIDNDQEWPPVWADRPERMPA